MGMQSLMDGFNAELMKEVNRPSFVTTGTYTAQVAEFKTRTNEHTQTEYLTLTLDLFADDVVKVGRCWLDLNPNGGRTASGKLRKDTELFYKLAKVLDVKDGEAMADKLSGAVFSVYGTEVYMGRNAQMPPVFQDSSKPETAWVKVYVNEGDETKREVLLDAELKPRFEVQRVGQHRG